MAYAKAGQSQNLDGLGNQVSESRSLLFEKHLQMIDRAEPWSVPAPITDAPGYMFRMTGSTRIYSLSTIRWTRTSPYCVTYLILDFDFDDIIVLANQN